MSENLGHLILSYNGLDITNCIIFKTHFKTQFNFFLHVAAQCQSRSFAFSASVYFSLLIRVCQRCA